MEVAYVALARASHDRAPTEGRLSDPIAEDPGTRALWTEPL